MVIPIVAVGVGAGPVVITLVAVGDGPGVAPMVVGDALGDGEPLATGDGDVTKPEGAVVGLSGLLPVTLPPPEEQAAAAMTAEPAINPSIKRLYMRSPEKV